MRKLFLLLVPGVMLGGCLTSDDSPNRNGGFYGNTAGNDAPIINGNPDKAIMVNDMYAFEPAAEDPDGDPLTFTVANKPAWASFDPNTGYLFGQPTLANIGTYPNIVVTVTDGEKSDSLPPFSVTVTDTALGSVTLNWQAPSENEDGTPLTDLAGYKIYYGKNSGTYSHEIVIDNVATTTHVVANLLPDTYYFAATAFNADGIESSFSGEAVRAVN